MSRSILIIAVLSLPLAGCQTQHKVDTNSVIEVKPIEIKPIYATIDVNVKVQVDRELDSFF
ncbi:MAG: YnbE family lipoprotein, partial [Acidobacteria bacterium]|nr:YnbE family lipoprotein [Acidobacteriota bacterium]